jgi:DNA polymerase kappa
MSDQSGNSETPMRQPESIMIAPQHTASALVISASDKAGMDGIDRARIDAIILRESKDSLFMQQQLRRDQKVNERIEQMRERLQQKDMTDSPEATGGIGWRRQLEKEMEPEIAAILSGRSTRSTKATIDMDMFFMACELLSRPELKDKPCCVGRNLISTSNYRARRYGVRSAMAGFIGDKLVEELSGGKEKLIHVPSNFELYREKSRQFEQVLREFDPHCRCASLDEAFVELGPYLALKLSNGWTHEQIKNHLAASAKREEQGGNAGETHALDFETLLQAFSSEVCLQAATEALSLLRQKVCDNTGGLTCSAGLGPNFVVAKIASDVNKPDGQKIIGPRLEEDVFPFIRKFPTRKIPGIGRVTQKILESFSILTVQHLYDQRSVVKFLFHPATANSLLRASVGGYKDANSTDPDECDDGIHATKVKRKGMSRERTFSPTSAWQDLNSRLEDIAFQLSDDLKDECLFSRTISLKAKLHTFDILQRSRSMPQGTFLQEGNELLLHAAEMLRELKRERKGSPFSLRLIGIRCSNLVHETDKTSNCSGSQTIMEKFLSSHQTGPKDSGLVPASSNVSTMPEELANETVAGGKLGKLEPAIGTSQDETSTTSFCDKATKLDNIIPKQMKSKSTACPICSREIAAESDDALNRALNDHIDSCLNAPLVRQAIEEETKRAGTNKLREPKKRRLTDFFSR